MLLLAYFQQIQSSHKKSQSSHIHLDKEREELKNEKQQFYEQLVAFEEKKRALADVEFHLNKEVFHSLAVFIASILLNFSILKQDAAVKSSDKKLHYTKASF